MTNLKAILDTMRKNTNEIRKNYLRTKLIEYYNTINQGKVCIPAFMLADADISRCEKEKTIDYWYKRLVEVA